MSLEIEIDPRARFSFEPRNWSEDLKEGVRGSVRNSQRVLGTVFTGFLTFSFTVLSGNPGYSIQMFSSGIEYWWIALITRFTGLLMNSGYIGVFLTMVFSFLVGITLTNTVIQFRMSKVDFSSLGALPGLLAGGCASCGVGVLSLLGFGGVIASLPFQGNLLRFGGVILLITLIIRNGNPDLCKLN